jgi:hypothetical protein
VADCAALLGALPQTFRALSEGAITWRHARVLIDHTRTLPDDARELFEATVLPFAKTLTVAKFDRRARIQREHAHPESIDMRSKDAISERFVDVTPDRDGMAWLNAYLPAVVAQGIYNRITDIAVSCQGPTEQRTLGHLRADVFADLLVDGVLPANGHGGIRAQVLVTVPVLALLGRSDEPAVLEGFGPIDLSTARELAAAAPSFTRLLTHPETGAVLSVGRTRYAVPADLRTWLRVRDGTCRFPGCSRAARKCELDHTKDWQFDGETEHNNLAHLCKSHHRLKHMTPWNAHHRPGGVLEWTSPSGRAYTTEPETHIGMRPPT